ncbi:ATP-binding protein [Rhodococcus sp. NPDC058521]|uniref:ATP-binding protein n=1 Tax=Rhodococcus sp. NPDC058521 TaxID=3346536 RepID=UPI0036618284
MANVKTIEPDQDYAHPVVELRIRATPDQLSVLRALAAAIAIHEDFDLDSIADIKLAMDEACTYLIVRATPEAVLVCRLQYLNNALHVEVSTTTAPSDDTRDNSFGWHVLNALTDSIDMTREPGVNRESITTIEFVRSKGKHS